MNTDSEGNEYYMLKYSIDQYRCMYVISARANKEHTFINDESVDDPESRIRTFHTHDARKHWENKINEGWNRSPVSQWDINELGTNL